MTTNEDIADHQSPLHARLATSAAFTACFKDLVGARFATSTTPRPARDGR